MIFMFVRKFRKIEYPREESLVNANRSLRIDFLLLPCHHAVGQSFFQG